MSAVEYTLPNSVIEVIEATGSPSAGLRKFKQLSGLVPVRRTYEVALGGVRKREQLGQFCSVFAPQIEAAKATFEESQAPAPTTRKASRKSEDVVLSGAEYHSLMQRLEALENGVIAEEPKAAQTPRKAKAQPAAKVAVSDKVNTFSAKVVEKFSLPTRSNATFVWASTGSTFVVVRKVKGGAIEARKVAA